MARLSPPMAALLDITRCVLMPLTLRAKFAKNTSDGDYTCVNRKKNTSPQKNSREISPRHYATHFNIWNQKNKSSILCMPSIVGSIKVVWPKNRFTKLWFEHCVKKGKDAGYIWCSKTTNNGFDPNELACPVVTPQDKTSCKQHCFSLWSHTWVQLAPSCVYVCV